MVSLIFHIKHWLLKLNTVQVFNPITQYSGRGISEFEAHLVQVSQSYTVRSYLQRKNKNDMK